jgi:ATP-binding cassette, subfamily C (CFTR/MRP), member 1
MNSIERVREYALLKPEAPEILPDNRPPRNWPAQGKIEFQDFCMKYGKVDTLALNNLNFSVKPRERVGIVGRSGAGKSSMMLALFRMVEGLSGRILIDDIDISSIGLNDLRTKLSTSSALLRVYVAYRNFSTAIIPQEPLLFAGNVRYNLDPFERFGDEELWAVLETVNLKDYIKSLPGQLDAIVEENGRNFSVGQRQLVCMARSLLARARILLLDEASASLDPVTDSLIQGTIRNSFPDSTILVIAHKIQTVVDLDRILVMSNGSMVEYDTPRALLSNKESVFSAMVRFYTKYHGLVVPMN